MSRRRIAGNLVALYAVQGMQYVIPFLILPIVTRAIGPERYGILSLWQSLAAVLVMVVEYGFAYTSIRAVNQAASGDERASVFWSTTWAKLILLVPASLLLVACSAFVEHGQDARMLGAAWLTLLASALSPAWYFIAIRRNAPVASMSAFATLAALVTMLALVRGKDDFYLIAFVQFSAPLVGSLLMLGYLARFHSPGTGRWDSGMVLLRIREGLPLFVMTLGAGAYSSFNPFLLGLVAPATQVADYALGERIARTARNALTPILTVMYPYAAESHRGSAALRVNVRRATWATLCLAALVTGVLVAAAPLAVWLLAGTAFATAVPATRILSLNIFVITAGHLASVQYLIAMGKERTVTIITLASAPVHIAAFLIAGHYFGALGGSVTYVATELAVTTAFVAIILRLRKTA